MIRSALLLSALALAGCLSAPVDRAADRAEAIVAKAGDEARRTAQDAVAAADARMAARLAEAAQAASTLRREAAEDIDRRLDAQRQAVAAELDRQRTETLAALKAEREALAQLVREESAAWREESAKWRATVGPVAAALAPNSPGLPDGSRPAPRDGDAGSGPTPEDRAMLWAGAAGAAFTLAKTGWRLWLARKAAA